MTTEILSPRRQSINRNNIADSPSDLKVRQPNCLPSLSNPPFIRHLNSIPAE